MRFLVVTRFDDPISDSHLITHIFKWATASSQNPVTHMCEIGTTFSTRLSYAILKADITNLYFKLSDALS